MGCAAEYLAEGPLEEFVVGFAEVDRLFFVVELLVEFGCPFEMAGAATEFAEEVGHACVVGDAEVGERVALGCLLGDGFLLRDGLEDHVEHFVEHADFAGCHDLAAWGRRGGSDGSETGSTTGFRGGLVGGCGARRVRVVKGAVWSMLSNRWSHGDCDGENIESFGSCPFAFDVELRRRWHRRER